VSAPAAGTTAPLLREHDRFAWRNAAARPAGVQRAAAEQLAAFFDRIVDTPSATLGDVRAKLDRALYELQRGREDRESWPEFRLLRQVQRELAALDGAPPPDRRAGAPFWEG